MAIRCDDCYRNKTKVKHAIEWNKDFSVIKYHPVEELIDVDPEIFTPLDELELGRGKIAG